MDQPASNKPLKPIGFTSDTYFVNRHPWVLWVPAIVGLLVGTIVGGGALDSKNQSANTSPVATKQTSTPSPTISDKWVVYTNVNDRYYFEIPSGWDMTEETSDYNTRLLTFSESKNASQMITVTYIANPHNMRVEELVNKYYPKEHLVFTSIKMPASTMALETSLHRNDTICAHGMDAYIPHNQKLYEISFTSCTSNLNDIVFKHLLNSLTFIDTPLKDLPLQTFPTSAPTGIVCTMEAKLCPDGSSVGRAGPKCDFAPCPPMP